MFTALLTAVHILVADPPAGGRGDQPQKPERVSVPLRRLANNNYLVAEAEVNGRAATLILDTAAPRTTLATGFASRAGLKVDQSGTQLYADGTVTPRRVTVIDRLSLNGVKLRNVPAVVLDLDALGGLVGQVDGVTPFGLLGGDLMSALNATIEYKANRLWLDVPRTGSADRSDPLTSYLAARALRWAAGPHRLGDWEYTFGQGCVMSMRHGRSGMRIKCNVDGSTVILPPHGTPVTIPSAKN